MYHLDIEMFSLSALHDDFKLQYIQSVDQPSHKPTETLSVSPGLNRWWHYLTSMQQQYYCDHRCLNCVKLIWKSRRNRIFQNGTKSGCSVLYMWVKGANKAQLNCSTTLTQTFQTVSVSNTKFDEINYKYVPLPTCHATPLHLDSIPVIG